VAAAITRLAIRGAPLIGVAAGYGLALALARDPGSLERARKTLIGARPTAVNLAWAVERVTEAARGAGPGSEAAVALAEAHAIEADEVAASAALARLGADHLHLIQPGATRRILTHCNTGALAAPGRGTALAVIAEAADRGQLTGVLVAETRPLLQGARLTTWELRRLGLPHELVVDGAAAGLIAAGEVDAVVLGCDRVAANGDVANKVGTYAHALAAAAAGIPFVVVGPTSTIDPACPTGADIVIEERDPEEVQMARTDAGLGALAPEATRCRNPAFDVTPAELVTALVTERGVVRPAVGESVLALLAG
jgi:methylthioribose-1-phosphate isomerase